MIGGVVEVRHCRPRFIRRVRRVRRVRFVSFTDVCQFWIKHTSCTHETKNIWMCCNHKSCALESTLFIRLWRMSILAIYMKWNGTTTTKKSVSFFLLLHYNICLILVLHTQMPLVSMAYFHSQNTFFKPPSILFLSLFAHCSASFAKCYEISSMYLCMANISYWCRVFFSLLCFFSCFS